MKRGDKVTILGRHGIVMHGSPGYFVSLDYHDIDCRTIAEAFGKDRLWKVGEGRDGFSGMGTFPYFESLEYLEQFINYLNGKEYAGSITEPLFGRIL